MATTNAGFVRSAYPSSQSPHSSFRNWEGANAESMGESKPFPSEEEEEESTTQFLAPCTLYCNEFEQSAVRWLVMRSSPSKRVCVGGLGTLGCRVVA